MSGNRISHSHRRARLRLLPRLVREGKTVAEIANVLGLSDNTVALYMRQRGLHAARPVSHTNEMLRSQARSWIDWSTVDWTKNDAMLARDYGLSRERFRQRRNALGKVASPTKNRAEKTVVVMKWLESHRELIRTNRFDVVRMQCPIKMNAHTLASLARKIGESPRYYDRQSKDITKENLESFCETTPSGCWLWKGSVHPVNGHGRMSGVYIRRHVYEMFNGPLDEGKEIFPAGGCANTRCVNPAHLCAMTHSAGIRAFRKKGRSLTDKEIAKAVELRERSQWTWARIAEHFGVSTQTVYMKTRRLMQVA